MNYKLGKDRNQLFLTSLEGMVSQESWARVVDAFVGALPIEEMGFTHSTLNRQGNEPYHPGDLFKLLLYGYRYGIRSAVKLEHGCHTNVELMWLLKGLRPSARTINYFRKDNAPAIQKAHRTFLHLLKNWDLLNGEIFAVDGTKIRAQNSLKRNFNRAKVKRHLSYIEERIDHYLDQLATEQQNSRKDKKKRIEQIEDKIEDLERRHDEYQAIDEQIEQSPNGQVSLSDPDARAVIKHRNIVEVGYNLQATVQGQHNIVVDVFCGGVNDLHELSKAGTRVQTLLGVERFLE